MVLTISKLWKGLGMSEKFNVIKNEPHNYYHKKDHIKVSQFTMFGRILTERQAFKKHIFPLTCMIFLKAFYIVFS
jgi:hypothetical protein